MVIFWPDLDNFRPNLVNFPNFLVKIEIFRGGPEKFSKLKFQFFTRDFFFLENFWLCSQEKPKFRHFWAKGTFSVNFGGFGGLNGKF